MTTTTLTFDEEALEIFWRFVCERQKIWHRRYVLELPQPWTKNPYLLKNKFTNVYRELDPGTRFSREKIMAVDAPRPDRVFNVMLYRLMCSIPTYQKVGFQYLETFDWKSFQGVLRGVYETGQPVFGNAYLISPYSSMGSAYKYENVARLFRNVHRDFYKFFLALDQAPTFERAYKTVNSLYGFGPFLAYQVCLDLTYSSVLLGDQPILLFSQNEWARLGPGAMRGMQRMVGYQTQTKNLEGLRYLWSHQCDFFERYGLKFPFLKDEYNCEVEISLANMQNCLCEFSKYMNIRKGTGKAQRLFTPTPLSERGW
jgi:5-hmdU DNA kinase, helical domain